MGLTDMDILFNNAVGYQLNRKKEVMLNLFQHLISRLCNLHDCSSGEMLKQVHCCPVKVFLKKVRSSRKATPFVLILELPHFNTQHE